MTQSRFLFLIFLLMLASPLPSQAKDIPEFTTLESYTTVTLASLRGQHAIIAFWRSDCAPCVAERPILTLIAKDHPDVRVVLISLDASTYDQRHFAKPSMANMEIWAANGDAAKTLHALGDTRGALPFSLFVRADGTTCAKHYGLLGTEFADGWVKQC